MLRIPLASWIDQFVAWLTVAGEPFSKGMSRFLLFFLVRLENFLLWVPWVVVVLAVALIAWRVAGWRLAAGSAIAMVFVGTLGLWDMAMKTLALVMAATILALAISVPTGIAMARSHMVNRIIQPMLDLMQTMPSFVYLIPAVMLMGLGKVPALLATIIYAVPPAIRLTNLGIRQVPSDVVEAAVSFGSTPSQLLFKVQLPLAMPTIMAGINQTIMMALAMVVVAAYIGAGGLGSEVLNGIARLEVGRGFAGGISIVVMAILIDRITQSLVKERKASA